MTLPCAQAWTGTPSDCAVLDFVTFFVKKKSKENLSRYKPLICLLSINKIKMERITFNDGSGIYAALRKGQDYVDNCGLEKELVKLIQFRVSQINSCAYCLDMHYKEAIHEGIDPVKLVSVSAWREAPYYSAKEQAVLAFAEELTHMASEQHSDSIHDELSKHFSKKEIANLTMTIIQINSWNRLTRSFGTVAGRYKVGDRKVQPAGAE
jgi:AhpD family alkylhydroperoxidase